MSQPTTQAPGATSAGKTESTTPATSLVDTLFDLGMSWAAYGLKMGKAALEQSAKTLETTARALDGVARELEKTETK